MGQTITSENDLSRIPYPKALIESAIEILSAVNYEGVPIFIDQKLNPKVQDYITAKLLDGQKLTPLERIIMDLDLLLKSGYKFEGKVNSASDFNENSFEKANKNYARLKVLSESMSGIPGLQPGAEVPMRLMPEGTQYKKGDIIVFYRDEIKIVHQVEYVHESNGKIFYVTTGVNTETNQYVDSDLVSQDDVIGVVDLSKEAYLELNEMMARRYVPSIRVFGMTLKSANILEDFVREKSTYLRNALKNAKDEATSRGLKLVSPNDPNMELSFEEFTLACIESYNGKNKFYGDAILTWKHEDCGHVWENTYNNIKRNVGTCPKCDSPWKNQVITFNIANKIFNGKIIENDGFQFEQRLDKIFDKETLKAYKLQDARIDMFAKLRFKDSNGEEKVIILAIEYDGRQHNEDPDIGFRAYQFHNKKMDLDKNSREYEKLYNEWLKSLKRDAQKDKLFSNTDGFYLLRVDYTVKKENRQDFIIEAFRTLIKDLKLENSI